MRSTQRRLLIALLLSLVLTIIPMPELFSDMRPAWILLLLLYLEFFMPQVFRLSILFIMGLLMDVLLATVIGEHIFALTFVTWVASNKTRRFHFFSIGQQMALIGFLCLLYQVILITIDGFLGYRFNFIGALGSAVLSILLWPWIRLLAEETLLLHYSQA